MKVASSDYVGLVFWSWTGFQYFICSARFYFEGRLFRRCRPFLDLGPVLAEPETRLFLSTCTRSMEVPSQTSLSLQLACVIGD